MPKAQKDHDCTLCHTFIRKGTKYIYETIKPWDHEDNEAFGTYKAHKHYHKWQLEHKIKNGEISEGEYKKKKKGLDDFDKELEEIDKKKN